MLRGKIFPFHTKSLDHDSGPEREIQVCRFLETTIAKAKSQHENKNKSSGEAEPKHNLFLVGAAFPPFEGGSRTISFISRAALGGEQFSKMHSIAPTLRSGAGENDALFGALIVMICLAIVKRNQAASAEIVVPWVIELQVIMIILR